MLNLTFGEQVKIVLSRKGMTIKELAETIEERTGKAMSRQNLTQRLGRDNFQEQDMRMIADILGCPFQLSILSEIELGDKNLVLEELEAEKKTEAAGQRFIVAGSHHEEEQDEEAEELQEEVFEETERDITIGELVDIHQELDAIEAARALENAGSETAEAGNNEVADTLEEAEVEEEPVEEEVQTEEAAEKEQEELKIAEEAVAESAAEPEVQEQETVVKKKTSVFKEYIKKPLLRGYNKAHAEELQAEASVKEEKAAQPEVQPESEPQKAAEEVKGELNPYTGREYETNSVRMHPKRIGYVQVYDRADHKWTDMTEWAFLGYQERKKALLGKDYEPPIYLD